MNWNTTELFDELSRRFAELSRAAGDLSTPNLEDDLYVRHAIVGFGLFCSVALWSQEHFSLVSQRLEHDLSLESLRDFFKEDAISVRLFSCLALGALLAKYQAGELDDSGFMLGDAHLPGYILMHTGELGRWVDASL